MTFLHALGLGASSKKNRSDATMGIFLSLVLSLFMFPVPGLGTVSTTPKTVHIILDDSGSMKTHNYWSLAGYAVQTVSVMLDEGRDQIFIHPMDTVFKEKRRIIAAGRGVKEDERVVLLENFQELMKHIRDVRPTGSHTPFTPVREAVDRIRKSAEASPERREHWLLVITDGDFNRDHEGQEEKAKEFSRIRDAHAVFLLIGRDVKDATAAPWEKHAGAHVLRAVNAREILPRLERIGRMITGAGDGAGTLPFGVWEKEAFVVQGDLPLARVLFLQHGDAAARLPRPQAENLPVVSYDFCQEEELNSRVLPDGCSRNARMGRRDVFRGKPGEILPQGTRILWPEKPKAPSVFAEAAAVLDVRFPKGERREGGWKLCAAGETEMEVRLLNPLTREALFMAHPEKLTFSVGGKALPLVWDGSRAAFSGGLPLPEVTGEHEMVARTEAAYPGYFQLFDASRIRIRPCLAETEATLQVTVRDGQGREIPPRNGSFLASPHGDVRLALGLLDTMGNSLAFDDPRRARVVLHHGGRNIPMAYDPQAKVFTAETRPAQGAEDLEIFLTTATGEKRNLPFRLFAHRDLRLEPEGNWSPSPLDFASAAPALRLVVDGTPAERLEDAHGRWALSLDGRKGEAPYLRVDDQESVTEGEGFWNLAQASYLSPCFCGSGTQDIEARLDHPVTGESLVSTHTFRVGHVPVWKRCWPLLAKILLFILFVWWLVGVLMKKRFASGARIIQTSSLGRVNMHHLTAGFLFRYLLPYRAERKKCGAILVKAGANRNVVFVSKDIVAEVERRGGRVLFDGMEGTAKGDNRLSHGTEMVIFRDGEKADTYRFEIR